MEKTPDHKGASLEITQEKLDQLFPQQAQRDTLVSLFERLVVMLKAAPQKDESKK